MNIERFRLETLNTEAYLALNAINLDDLNAAFTDNGVKRYGATYEAL